ncbi:hypothetical protein ANANG_G00250070 [Anguilla anguilla]|uniref:DH domain-containing protein n=1 Tax=Anguilla anguilla TaxID=7936 RepID=A0A9D3LS51_ANGAN|nr:hypothetical protein ANANG_G00250070 [Anguilla anguilla]
MEREENEVDASPSWSPVGRERLFTCANLSDYAGKKRKQDTSSETEAAARGPDHQDEDDDTIGSLEASKDLEEPSNKRVKPVAKGAGLSVKTPALKRLGQSIQRSISFRTEVQPLPMAPIRTRQKASSYPRRRNSQLWSDTVDTGSQELSTKEIKRQEVIYELTQGEKQLIEDLDLVRKVYYEPMLKLEIMTENELVQIFGTLDSLIPVHKDFLSRLESLRGAEKTVEEVGPTLLEWFPRLEAYITYCCNQVEAKALLDQKKQERPVEHFLRLCQESSFSRKLDLWNFLDLPRSRLVKYPLLLREIEKSTPPEHPDKDTLPQAMELIQAIISEVNSKTGEAECQFYRRGCATQRRGRDSPRSGTPVFFTATGNSRTARARSCMCSCLSLLWF